ncbi:MAG: methylated-DNA--[protein]-cysteine S-methyltransferase [Spirochaetaceae bacterium]|jgi:methylated-DNA-[protein]-cysteine S-methyltransferase|nr:methylated-DNA--[protein]-cysteine S-methyltransferase [Spirochaetaceae bacterium]
MKTGACAYYQFDFDGLKTRLAFRAHDEKLIEISFGEFKSGRGCSGAFDADILNAGGLDAGGAVEIEIIETARRQITEYAAGLRRVFDLPFNLSGTDFQMKVWGALLQIPYGETATYREIAQAAGNRAACRAAGGAVHRNPLAIVVPCHRVIGADGSLTGFGGGLPVKEKLLSIERRFCAR